MIASRWVVSDRAARGFMARFYEAWRARGLPVDEALAEAKRASLRAGGDAAHPSAWAAFVLWGTG